MSAASKPAAPRRPVIAAEYAKRFNMACDNHDMCPPLHYGRLRWICDQLKSGFDVAVSRETVRRWSSGEGRPRPDKNKMLAEILKVDEAWLSLGMTPEGNRKSVSAMQNAAVNLLSGMLLARDITVAIPDENDPLKDCVNLYAVIAGRQLRLHATFGHLTGDKVKVTLPMNFEYVNVVAVVPAEREAAFKLFHILPSAISRYGNKRGGYIELTGETNQSIRVKDIDCPEITSLKAML